MHGMLSTTQTAQLAGTTRFTVEREIRRGNLAAEKVGRTWVIDLAEAERWATSFTPYAGLRGPAAADEGPGERRDRKGGRPRQPRS